MKYWKVLTYMIMATFKIETKKRKIKKKTSDTRGELGKCIFCGKPGDTVFVSSQYVGLLYCANA